MPSLAGWSGRLAVVDRLSSELLGFAPDARVLIVNCDDFGMHDAVNAAVVESIETGIASSCSLMVPCPAAANAMRLLRERPHISFGIHLALIRGPNECRWGPAAAKADVPSLLDPDTDELYLDTLVPRAAVVLDDERPFGGPNVRAGGPRRPPEDTADVPARPKKSPPSLSTAAEVPRPPDDERERH